MPAAAEEEIQEKDESVKSPAESTGLQVDLSEDEDETVDGENNAPASGGESKKGRRQSFRKLRDTLEGERTARASLEREIAELRGRVDGIRSQVPAPVQQAQETDPIDQEIDGLWDQQQFILGQLRAEGIPDAHANRLQEQWRKLDRKRRTLEIKQAVGGEIQQPPSQQDYENRMLAAEFPEVFGDSIRLQEAKTELMKLVRQGKPLNIITARAAAQAVQGRYVRKPAPLSDSDRAKHASVSGRAGAQGSGDKFTPSSGQLRTARAFTSHLEGISDEERVRIWAKKVGKKNNLIG